MASLEFCQNTANLTLISECRSNVAMWPQCSDYWNLYIGDECSLYCENDYNGRIENNLEAPMPWIGMYIAAASAVCTLAMAADAFNGFRRKKFWFPCKYFSLNAFSLTLLAVAMKLLVDLTASTKGTNDAIARVGSLVMMSTAIGNFMTSIATMSSNDILLNVTALGILVITIGVNVCIHIAQTRDVFDGRIVLGEKIGGVVCMLLLLVLLCSSAVAIPTTKNYSEAKYFEMQNTTPNERGPARNFEDLRGLVEKHWVMAETGSPQFVMARSVISATSGLICLLMAVILVEAYVRVPWTYSYHYESYVFSTRSDSNYKWSTKWILYIQSGGVAIGIIAPLLRGLLVVRLWSLNCTDCKSFKNILKIEAYWTQMLVDWRESSLPLQIRHYQCKKILHDVKRLLLNFCIGIQTVIVFTSKLLLLFSVIFAAAALSCFRHIINNFKTHNGMRAVNDTGGSESDINFRRFALLLEGEPHLPNKILANICNEADYLIQTGTKQRPKNLIKFLPKSQNFNGVKAFDSRTYVPSLHSHDQEPPNCWSLPVVTLTSIAIAISPSTVSCDNKVKQLVSSVSEGLAFVKLIEKTLDTNGELVNIRNAADTVWVGVELYRRWQDKELQRTNILNSTTHKETLQELSSIAEKTVIESFKTTSVDHFLMKNPLKWPGKVLAANSMHRIIQTFLQAHEQDNLLITDDEEGLFDCLSVMISDILAACLTNLPQVILKKCQSNDIKERSKNVREAAILLGESEEILQIVQQLEFPSNIDPEKTAYIEEWRAVMERETMVSVSRSASHDSTSSVVQANGSEHVFIEVHEG